ncbi:MAG: hypothetical protein IT457_20390 [Planctomycetes bacterium]|nr:hypothetical protein [Planctomycetota bacterium]
MSLKDQEAFGDDLAVVFVEVQGHSIEEVEAFGMKMGWLGGKSHWTTERVVASNAKGIPNFVLLDVEGRRILEGNPLAMKKQIEEAIAAQIAIRQKGPADVAKELKPVWRDTYKGKFAAAMQAAQKLALKPVLEEEAAALVEAATKLIDEIGGRASRSLDRVGRLIDGGFYARASELLADADKNLDGMQDLDARRAELRTRLESDELESERAAEKALLKFERALFEKGSDAVPAKALQKFAEKHAGTKAATRAQRLIAALGAKT